VVSCCHKLHMTQLLPEETYAWQIANVLKASVAAVATTLGRTQIFSGCSWSCVHIASSNAHSAPRRRRARRKVRMAEMEVEVAELTEQDRMVQRAGAALAQRHADLQA